MTVLSKGEGAGRERTMWQHVLPLSCTTNSEHGFFSFGLCKHSGFCMFCIVWLVLNWLCPWLFLLLMIQLATSAFHFHNYVLSGSSDILVCHSTFAQVFQTFLLMVNETFEYVGTSVCNFICQSLPILSSFQFSAEWTRQKASCSKMFCCTVVVLVEIMSWRMWITIWYTIIGVSEKPKKTERGLLMISIVSVRRVFFSAEFSAVEYGPACSC